MAAVKVVMESHPAMDIPVTQLPPGDPRLVEAIVSQLKSKGIFDQFRKECLADVDTKPAFQNLRQRVEGHVNKFLEKRTWKNDINKNQLRDGVRKHVNSLGILDSGIDAIITQVVNPKIKPLILPYVEDTVYAFLQIDKPKRERQGANASAPDDSVILQVNTAPDIKPSLLPMETDVISSEEDDILVRESPESEHKSPPSSHDNFMEPENEDAQDGFENFPLIDDSNTDNVASHVEKLSLTDNTEESKPLLIVKPPLPLFDDQSLDSISSNSSGLTFSTLSGKGSPGSRKSSDKDDNTKQEPRSATSTPLVDEKPMDEEISQSSVTSEPPKEYPGTVSEAKTADSHSPRINPIQMSGPSHFATETEKDDQTVVSGASLISQDDDSQESRSSTSKGSLSSYKFEVEEKSRSEKSEGELSTSNSELSDPDNKCKTEQLLIEGKLYSDSPHKSNKPKGEHRSKSELLGREQDKGKDRDSKYSKEKDKKHTKSRDDHHSHRDKDKKYHRRDKDHDGDKERSRSHHHHQSSSSTSKDGSGSGKSSSEKDKEHSSHNSGDKSTEGKSKRENTGEKDKSIKQAESKLEGMGIEIRKQNSTGDKNKSENKSDKSEIKSNNKSEKNCKHGIKADSKTDKPENKHSFKSEGKSGKLTSEKIDKKPKVHSSKNSSKHKKHDGDRILSDKYKSINIFKDDKKRKDEKNMKKEKEGLESKHTKEEKESKHEKEGKEKKYHKEGKDQKKEVKVREESHHREEKDHKRIKEEKDKDAVEEKGKRNDKEVKLKTKDGKTVKKEDKCNGDKKLKLIKLKGINDKVRGGHEMSNRKVKSHKESLSKKCLSSSKEAQIKDDGLLLFKDEKSVIMVSYDDDKTGADGSPKNTEKLKKYVKKGLKDTNNAKKMENNLIEKTQKQNDAKDSIPDFEGFSNIKKDTRLADFLATAHRVPDEMDMEYSDWFDESDLHMVVSEDDIKERMDFSEFLSCMNKLGAVVQEAPVDTSLPKVSVNSKDCSLSETQNTPEKKTHAQLQGKRRRMSTSSSTSSSASLSGSPKHKRVKTDCMSKTDAGQLVEQDPVIVSGFALLTPEDDGNRTSSRDYEVDYSQRINTYSPLSPASDSSADDGKGKLADSSISGRPASSQDSNQRTKDDMFKPANTWTNEEKNLSV